MSVKGRDIETMLDECWANVSDVSPTPANAACHETINVGLMFGQRLRR